MIPVKKAISTVEKHCPRLGAETSELSSSIGRILVENIVADTDLPPFDRSQMDGYAVVAADTINCPVKLKVVGESAAGHGFNKKVKRGEAVAIMTGARLPDGADAVQKIELTSIADSYIEIVEPTEKGRYIVRKGSEIAKGKVVFRAGEAITENSISALAAFGYAKVKVGKRPRISILGTGSEIVEVNKKPGRDQIRNSNSVMLKVMAEKCGAMAEIFPIAGDDLKELKAAIKSAAKGKDILVATGGVSVGKYDLTKAALTELGAEIYFEKVRLKPGKPVVFARLAETLIFGLPGNPVSSAVTFHLFVKRAILMMQGLAEHGSRKSFAVLGSDAKAAKERDTYLPSRTETNKLGQLVVHPLKWHGSSDLIGFARADSLIFIAKDNMLKAGEIVEIVHL